VVDFKHTLVILASNIGSSQLELHPMAFTSQKYREQDRQDWELEHSSSQVIPLLRRLCKPELLNHVDEIVVFHKLEEVHLRQIVDVMVAATQQRMQEQAIGLQVTDEACCLLVKHGYDPVYGARPLRRAVQRLLEDMLAEAILRTTFVSGDMVVVGAVNGQLEAKKLVAVTKAGKGARGKGAAA
jgi:ATP-dependent Clp protease ATP-binding subunit ClpC